MIDVSDGVASEVRHICEESNVGALVDARSIPIHPEVEAAAKRLGHRGLDYALSGGEDFELIFTIKEADLTKLKTYTNDLTVIGSIVPGKEGVKYKDLDGIFKDLPGGYDHFSG
jgi:thiamine-monophosphate kinase